jgi:tRNA pseudouridine55 synthase
VPVYSAIKQKGVPLYKRARRGEHVMPPKKKMEIRRILLREIRREEDKTILDVVMDVGSGTYVRSIAEEVGKCLGVPATVKELRRTKVGDFDVKGAKRLTNI